MPRPWASRSRRFRSAYAAVPRSSLTWKAPPPPRSKPPDSDSLPGPGQFPFGGLADGGPDGELLQCPTGPRHAEADSEYLREIEGRVVADLFREPDVPFPAGRPVVEE